MYFSSISKVKYFQIRSKSYFQIRLGQFAVIRHLRRLISNHQPDFLFLSESKLSKSDHMLSIVNSLGFDCYDFVVSNSRLRGLVLMWHDVLNIHVTLTNDNVINCLLLDDLINCTWQFSFVYGPPILMMRAVFWDWLTTIGTTFLGLWCLIGDFNALLHQDDKDGGRPISSSSTGFQKFINDFGLIDMGFLGHLYTWSNRRSGKANMQE